MAKTSMVQREHKRTKTVAKFAVKRAELKAVISSVTASDEERWEAQQKLQKLPRDASQYVSVTAVRSRDAHMGFTVSLACAETSYAKQQCVVKFRGWLKPVGKLRSQTL